MSLLVTKTRIPNPTSNLVARPRLIASLDALLQPGCQVALVSAPAGFGKTTVLAQWLQTVPESFRVGWVSLDEADNSLVRFFAYVAAALQNADPAIGENFSALVEAHPELTADDAVSYLVNQTAASAQNILLVIDDIHVISAAEVHRALAMFVDHIPSTLRLVIAGRVDPSLPLARLRVRGQLVEVRTADLRFNVDETGGFLDRFAGLPSPVISLADALNRSTEGWAAGLQMTVIALRTELQAQGGQPGEVLDRLVHELSGSHRYILDYLLDEVLNRESPRVREFLLRTCLLERFNADLCAVLCAEETDATEAQSMLEYLERANLFIIPLDDRREWFRYHHLFADVLQKQLLHAHPGLAPDLHRRAADWFERQGRIEEAIAHAQRSGDPKCPQVLVEKYALEAILRGQIATAVRWLDSLPADALLASPRLCLDRAWALTFTSQTEAAVPYLERAESLQADKPEIRAEIFGLQSYQKSIYGQTGEALHLAKLALQSTPEKNRFLQYSNRMFLAIALVRNGKLEEALNEYHSLRSACNDPHGLDGLALLEADFLQFVAVYLNARNESQRAIQLLREAIQTFETVSTGNRRTAALHLYIGLGKILYIGNELAEAERVLKTGLVLDPLSLSLAAIDGRLTLWWVKIGQRDYPAARRILVDLEASVRNCDEKINRLVMLPGALQDLLEGNIASATTRLQALGFTDDVDAALARVSDSELMGWRANEYFVYARVLAARGKFRLGLRVLERMAQAARDFGLDWILYRAWITQATIYYQDNQTDTAMEIMAQLLEKTSQAVYGAVQVFLSTGEPARTLLQEARRRGLHIEHVDCLLAAFPPPVQPGPVTGLPEALSEREIEVLLLMADGLKNQEIADRLVVSLNTVRYHSKNIFGKLSVDNRTAAVARARELGLLN
jgi:LuxR family maltose regulon positive regulatory protein